MSDTSKRTDTDYIETLRSYADRISVPNTSTNSVDWVDDLRFMLKELAVRIDNNSKK